jgi:hypothetical protein
VFIIYSAYVSLCRVGSCVYYCKSGSDDNSNDQDGKELKSKSDNNTPKQKKSKSAIQRATGSQRQVYSMLFYPNCLMPDNQMLGRWDIKQLALCIVERVINMVVVTLYDNCLRYCFVVLSIFL